MNLNLQSMRMVAQVAVLAGSMICGVLSIQLPAGAQWPTMRVDALEIVGGQIGSTIDVRVLAGSDCESATALLNGFSSEGTSASDASTSKLPFQLRSRPDTVIGFYPIRLQGPFGLSNSRNVWLTKEPWQTVTTDHNSSERAFPVGSGIIYSGRFEPRKEIFFQLNLPEQTNWRLDCTTRAIDSQAIALLEVRGPSDESVSVDTYKRGGDQSIAFEAKQPGRYLVKMSDHLYRGGPDFPYAIQLIQQSSSLDSHDAKPSISIDHSDPRTFTDPSQLLAAKIDNNRPTITHQEHEFNDNHPMPVNFDSVIYGRFDNPRDKDSFEVFLEEGKSIAIDTLSSQLGQATDIKISVFPASSSEGAAKDKAEDKSEKIVSVADVDDQESIGTADLTLRSSDPCFVFTAKKEGLYRIVLYDQQRSPQDVYRRATSKNYYLQLRQPQPGFDLLAYFAAPASKPQESNPVSPTLFKKQIGCIEVLAIRRDGFADPIQVYVENLPDGVLCKPVVIASGCSQSSLMIDGTQIESNALNRSLRILGKTIQSASAFETNPSDESKTSVPSLPQESRIAYAAEITHGPIPTRPVPLARLIQRLSLATSTAFTVPIAIRLGSDGEELSSMPAIPLPILKSQKTDAAKGGNAPKEKKQESHKHKLLVRVPRGFGADHPVIIHGFHLPQGVSLSELTIQGDQSQGELEISIEDSITLANFELIVVGETKLQMQEDKFLNVQLWSLPRTIELTPQEETPKP